jgi:hypothetical protein
MDAFWLLEPAVIRTMKLLKQLIRLKQQTTAAALAAFPAKTVFALV